MTETRSEELTFDSIQDTVRGFAIILVMAFHITVNRYGWFAWTLLPVFYLVSGYVLALSALRKKHYENWPNWYRRRIVRILPSYSLVVLLGLAVVLAFEPFGRNYESVADGKIWKQTLLDLLMLRNFDHNTMFGYPNSALWFVSFIFGFYLCFPFLFEIVRRNRARLTAILIGSAALEVLIRWGAIFFLDGHPVGAGAGFLTHVGIPPEPIDKLPPDVGFQLWVPFGHWPTHVFSFMVGIAGGFIYHESPERIDGKIGTKGYILLGLFFMGLTQVAAYSHIGWGFIDLGIAVGLPIFSLGLAPKLFYRTPRFYNLVRNFGIWSYHLFLAHLLVMYVYAQLYDIWSAALWSIILAQVLLVFGVWGLAFALILFDITVIKKIG